MTRADAQALLGKKMAPMGDATLENRVKQLERENKALWIAHGELQCDLNKLKASDD
tara:strand:+ start:1076 stop:1243 length:168 start_codon:yes stop_codon:yes gene_type:complete